jgi:antitoxin (DNA-binding transcriptional repressor) of toxin-antitoxin stability system
MAQVHMTQTEAARDFHVVSKRVCEGAEVVIDRDDRPVAGIRAAQGPGRSLDEGIDAHREPVDPPVWD